MIQNLFVSILEVSVSTSIVIIIFTLFAPFLTKRYTAKWKYLTWIILAIRLIFPFNWNLSYQQFNITIPSKIAVPITTNTTDTLSLPLTLSQKQQTNFSLIDILTVVWLTGILIFSLIHIISYFYYKKQMIKDGISIKNNYILQQLNCLSNELKIKNIPPIITYSKVSSPMVIGFFHPILVLPDEQYTEEEIFFILKHELIHLKRHDLYYKLLLVISNAVHWFNPIIYIMLKEAAIDMELSCDECVVHNTTYAIKKAYTETLFTTIDKQYKKKTTLSTQFYGGAKIMKKRFKNILAKQKKRNGVILLCSAIVLTLSLGTLVGCSIIEPLSQEPSGNDKKTSEQLTENISPTVSVEEEKSTDNQTQDSSENNEVLSTDGQEIKEIVEAFSKAYFSGDTNGIKNYLTDPYEWDIEVFNGTTEVTDIFVKGVDTIQEKNIGDICVVSLEYKTNTQDDTFQYLTIELIKQSDGWNIQFYGTEI